MPALNLPLNPPVIAGIPGGGPTPAFPILTEELGYSPSPVGGRRHWARRWGGAKRGPGSDRQHAISGTSWAGRSSRATRPGSSER